MKPLRCVAAVCALWMIGSEARAAWSNVFQVTCFSCRKPAVVSNYAPDPCCNPCPQPTCTTQYVQRCYYQPVTSYETRSYYEPVTTYRMSYYYEPVTSYRYVSYYDPCNCSCQQVAVPQTCYRLRSQCCPVQNWVQRCYQVAVTNYRQVSYYEPVTSCNYPPPAGPLVPQPAVTTTPPASAAPPPGVSEQRSPSPPPGVSEQHSPSPPPAPNGSGSPLYERYYPPSNPMPPATGTVRPVPQQLPVAPPPPVRLDRIVSVPGPRLQGQLVNLASAPRAGAQIVLVSSTRQGEQHPVTTDSRGQFRVTLASGTWLVYVTGADGKRELHSRIELSGDETREMTLVSK